jgi:hypothetical protein
MSEVRVNKLSPRSGTTVTLGDSGDTITIPSGVTFDASSGGLAGTLTTAAQPNITSVGTLTSFTSTGIDDNATSTAITIDSSENVGIGETSPVGKLHIKSADSGTTLNTAAGQLFLENSGNAGITIGSGASSLGLIYFADSGDGNVGRLEYSHSENSMRFWTNDSERMRIDSSGNVGIGTSSPSATLHIAGNSSPTTEFKVGNSSWNTSNSNAGLLHRYASSTGYSELQINNVATSPATSFTIRNSTGVAMSFTNDGAGTFNGKLTVNDNIDANNITNRASIQGVNPTPDDSNSYELGAGYLNLFRDDTATVKQILFGKNGSEVGSISTTGSATAYNTSSDYRLKENVVDLTNATERLKQLQPKRFNFISNADTTVDGFLAHEVSSVVPEAITGTYNEVKTWKEYEELPEGVSVGDNKLDENGNTIPEYQGIDQSKLVPLLVKTIQELEARITALENA